MGEDKNKLRQDTKASAATGCQGLAASPQLYYNQNDRLGSVFILYQAKMCSGGATFGLKMFIPHMCI